MTVDSFLSNYTFKSSNEQVATVDKNGKITAVGEGEATITVTLGSMQKTCVVTVKPFETENPGGDTQNPGGDTQTPDKTGCGSSLTGAAFGFAALLLTVGCVGLKKKS